MILSPATRTYIRYNEYLYEYLPTCVLTYLRKLIKKKYVGSNNEMYLVWVPLPPSISTLFPYGSPSRAAHRSSSHSHIRASIHSLDADPCACPRPRRARPRTPTSISYLSTAPPSQSNSGTRTWRAGNRCMGTMGKPHARPPPHNMRTYSCRCSRPWAIFVLLGLHSGLASNPLSKISSSRSHYGSARTSRDQSLVTLRRPPSPSALFPAKGRRSTGRATGSHRVSS